MATEQNSGAKKPKTFKYKRQWIRQLHGRTIYTIQLGEVSTNHPHPLTNDGRDQILLALEQILRLIKPTVFYIGKDQASRNAMYTIQERLRGLTFHESLAFGDDGRVFKLTGFGWQLLMTSHNGLRYGTVDPELLRNESRRYLLHELSTVPNDAVIVIQPCRIIALAEKEDPQPEIKNGLVHKVTFDEMGKPILKAIE